VDFALPAGFPTADKFPAGKVVTMAVQNWSFHRNPGTGGGNAGQDMVAPDGNAVVGIDFGITSDHGAGAGGIDLHVVFPPGNPPINFPIGFHAGARLEPGGIGGAGATYAGGVTLKIVALADYFPVFFAMNAPH
jgi:hypothetical protein